MEIRAFLPADEAATIALWEQCGLVVAWNDPSQDIQRKASEHPELFFVGELAGNIIGSVMGGYDGHRGWVNYLAVAPEYQSKGYARALMEALEARLINLGCPKLNLQIRESNLDVIRFYEAIDYQADPVLSYGKRLVKDN